VLTLLGVDLVELLLEMLGHRGGLCGGNGGHMHLFSRAHLAASSGIVGACGPLGAGFALAAKLRNPGAVAVAFFGEGAVNQGMLLEAFNLASAWSLPLLFVCKDNGWSITTRSADVTGGNLLARAEGFGLRCAAADGLDPMAVQQAAQPLLERARRGKGAGFLLAECMRADGHFLGDPLVRMARQPYTEGGPVFSKVFSASVSGGGSGLGARAGSMVRMMDLLMRARKDGREGRRDPLVRCRKELKGRAEELELIDREVAQVVEQAVQAALAEVA